MMHRGMTLLFVLAFVCLVLNCVQAKEVFVSPTGSDDNNCESGVPCLTLQKAMTVVAPFDTIVLRGLVKASVVHVNVSNITIRGEAESQVMCVILRLQDIYQPCFRVTATGTTFESLHFISPPMPATGVRENQPIFILAEKLSPPGVVISNCEFRDIHGYMVFPLIYLTHTAPESTDTPNLVTGVESTGLRIANTRFINIHRSALVTTRSVSVELENVLVDGFRHNGFDSGQAFSFYNHVNMSIFATIQLKNVTAKNMIGNGVLYMSSIPPPDNKTVSALIEDCLFVNNTALYVSLMVFDSRPYSFLVVRNTTFLRNNALRMIEIGAPTVSLVDNQQLNVSDTLFADNYHSPPRAAVHTSYCIYASSIKRGVYPSNGGHEKYLQNCTFRNNTQGGVYSLAFASISINQCQFIRNEENPVLLYGGSNMGDIKSVISNCWFFNNTDVPITLDGDHWDMNLINNTFRLNVAREAAAISLPGNNIFVDVVNNTVTHSTCTVPGCAVFSCPHEEGAASYFAPVLTFRDVLSVVRNNGVTMRGSERFHCSYRCQLGNDCRRLQGLPNPHAGYTDDDDNDGRRVRWPRVFVSIVGLCGLFMLCSVTLILVYINAPSSWRLPRINAPWSRRPAPPANRSNVVNDYTYGGL